MRECYIISLVVYIAAFQANVIAQTQLEFKNVNFDEYGASATVGATGFAGPFLYRNGLLSDRLTGVVDVWSPNCDFTMQFSADNDGKYPTFQSFELGHHFEMDEGRLTTRLGELSISAGRIRQSDAIESPYTLFISSEAIPALGVDMVWNTPIFKYESRWIRLNSNSDQRYEGLDSSDNPYPLIFDRGLNYKLYSLKLGNFTIGYQDSSVYLFRDFDPESLFNPIPTFIQQMILAASGRPYSEIANPNSLMGIFCAYGKNDVSSYAQILVDDINASFLAPLIGWAIPSLWEINNVQKIAWTLGGNLETRWGRFGFHHGGATKYTFEATYTRTTNPDGFLPAAAGPDYNILPYEYCYYPFTAFNSFGNTMYVDYIDNYIGFKYGENTLAFQADYSNDFFQGEWMAFSLDASLEYVANGSKSPNNPWHELDTFTGIGKAFSLLDDPVLEHDLIIRVDAVKQFHAWEFTAHVELGYVWNRLEAQAAEGLADEAVIWTPLHGNDHLVAGFSIGIRYSFSMGIKQNAGINGKGVGQNAR